MHRLLVLSLAFLLLILFPTPSSASTSAPSPRDETWGLTWNATLSKYGTMVIAGNGGELVYFISDYPFDLYTVHCLNTSTNAELPVMSYAGNFTQHGLRVQPVLTWLQADTTGQLHAYDYKNGAILAFRPQPPDLAWVRVLQTPDTAAVDPACFAVSPDGQRYVVYLWQHQQVLLLNATGHRLLNMTTLAKVTSVAIDADYAFYLVLWPGNTSAIEQYSAEGELLQRLTPANTTHYNALAVAVDAHGNVASTEWDTQDLVIMPGAALKGGAGGEALHVTHVGFEDIFSLSTVAGGFVLARDEARKVEVYGRVASPPPAIAVD
jgi:hypothetical protein